MTAREMLAAVKAARARRNGTEAAAGEAREWAEELVTLTLKVDQEDA